MTDCMLFGDNHPFSLRWTPKSGRPIIRTGGLHRISEIGLTVRLREPLRHEDAPHIGDPVRAEAGEFHGRHLNVFHGTVVSVNASLLRMRFDGQIDQVQRRRSPRIPMGHQFARARLIGDASERYFVVQPVDLSAGGVRIKHRVPLHVDDEFHLVLRLSKTVTVTPVAKVVQVWDHVERHPGQHPFGKQPTAGYVSRARFTEISDRDRNFIARYVAAMARRAS